MGVEAATVAGYLGLGDATEGVGDPTGTPLAPPPVGAHGILPLAVALLPEAGGCGENFARGPPL